MDICKRPHNLTEREGRERESKKYPDSTIFIFKTIRGTKYEIKYLGMSTHRRDILFYFLCCFHQ
jgi:hypothetical protein